MKIYKIYSEANGHKCLIHGKNDRSIIKLLNSNEELDETFEIEVRVNREFGHGDFLDFNFAEFPMLNESSYDVLYPYICADMYNPIICNWVDENQHGWVYGIRLKSVDCIDLHNSQYKEIKTGCFIFRKYVFFTEKIREKYIFRIPEDNFIYATSLFYNLVQEKQLTGFYFSEVFSDDEESEKTSNDIDNTLISHSNISSKYHIEKINSDKTLSEIFENIAYGKKILGVCDSASDSTVIDLVYHFCKSHRNVKRAAAKFKNDDLGIAIAIATVWSELVCKKYHWEWKKIYFDNSDKGLTVLVSPQEMYYIDPINLFNDICNKKKENVSLLLFNILDGIEENESNVDQIVQLT